MMIMMMIIIIIIISWICVTMKGRLYTFVLWRLTFI